MGKRLEEEWVRKKEFEGLGMTLEGSAEDKKGLFLTGCYLNESETSLEGLLV